MMIYPLMIFLITAIVSLVVVGFKKPDILKSSSFPMTRKCLGLAIISYGIAHISMQSVIFEKEWLVISILAQLAAWVLVVIVYRGIFEMLGGR